jgi:hypothetical protein
MKQVRCIRGVVTVSCSGLLLRYSPLALLASSVVVPLGFLFLRPSAYRALIVRCHGSGKEVLERVFCVERKGCSLLICCCCFRSENFFFVLRSLACLFRDLQPRMTNSQILD